jgi:hypothetical protein
MFKDLLELGKQVLTMATDVQRTKEEIKESKAQILKLVLMIQELTNKMERIAQEETHEREKFMHKMEMLVQQERNAREKFELQMRLDMADHFQSEMAKFERQHAQVQTIEYIGQLPKQFDGVQAIVKLKDTTQE